MPAILTGRAASDPAYGSNCQVRSSLVTVRPNAGTNHVDKSCGRDLLHKVGIGRRQDAEGSGRVVADALAGIAADQHECGDLFWRLPSITRSRQIHRSCSARNAEVRQFACVGTVTLWRLPPAAPEPMIARCNPSESQSSGHEGISRLEATPSNMRSWFECCQATTSVVEPWLSMSAATRMALITWRACHYDRDLRSQQAIERAEELALCDPVAKNRVTRHDQIICFNWLHEHAVTHDSARLWPSDSSPCG